MLKKPITYTTFDDETVTETFYFNLSAPEIIDLDAEYEGGLFKMIQRIGETVDHNEVIALFKKLIWASYGEKSEDGRRFIKSEKISEEFTQTGAYPVLFMQLAQDGNAAAEFVTGILPKDLAANVEAEAKKLQTLGNSPDTPPPFQNPAL